MKDVRGLRFMSISLGSKSQFSPNLNGCDSFPDATSLQILCCIQAEPKKTSLSKNKITAKQKTKMQQPED